MSAAILHLLHHSVIHFDIKSMVMMAQSHPSISTPPSETNLKVKQALTVTGELGDEIDALAHFKGETST